MADIADTLGGYVELQHPLVEGNGEPECTSGGMQSTQKAIAMFDNVFSAATPRREGYGPLDMLEGHLDAMFSVREMGSTVERELRAGLVTWVTMSYIVVVNPMILSAASSDGGPPPIPFHAACRATCFSAAVASAFVGFAANLPFGMAAGMGLNSYLRYGAIAKLGLSAGGAFACCFAQAIIFAVLAASGFADRLQDILPSSLKSAITVAIGVFQAFVGFQLMGLVVQSDSTLVGLGDIYQPALWLALTSTILVAALLVTKTKGALLLGIGFTTFAWQLLHLPNANEAARDASQMGTTTSFGLDFSAAFQDPQAFFTAVICMLFVVVFDTAGVQHGIGQQAGLLDEHGRLPGAKYSYLASAIGTGLGAVLGTSPVIIHNESAAGVQEGGRTGLCAVTTALLFMLSPMLVPLIELIPQEATAPCLVLVGTMMMAPVRDIDFSDLRIALPAFLIICVTPLTYSISAGIFSGICSYVVLGAILRLTEAASRLGESIGNWSSNGGRPFSPSIHHEELTAMRPPGHWMPEVMREFAKSGEDDICVC
jgi:AGZA family xanthine/uracil permease-like MFS transporter